MTTLPYITSPGNIDKALKGIAAAGVPEKVTQDYVKTILKIPGGSGTQMTTYLKKINLVSSDGTPNELYKKYRNPNTSGQAIAKCIKHAYAPLYVRNEYMHELGEKELTGLIIEETGQAHDSNPVKLILSCIQRLKSFADFSESDAEEIREVVRPVKVDHTEANTPSLPTTERSNIGLNLGYTINLNLPATSDPAVFDAIFKSLKENLLRDEDA